VIVLLQQGCGLLTMGLVFGGSEVLVKVVQFIFAWKLLPNVSITFKNVDFKLLKEMLGYGVNTCLYTTGGLLILKAAELVIAIFIGTAEVSQFTVAVAGVFFLSQVLRAFTTAIKPAVSDLDARQEHSHVREISFLTQKYSLLLIVPAACFFIMMGKEFLHVWVGEKFQEPNVVNGMGVILAVLTVGHCLRLAQYSNFLVLVGKGDHRIFGLLTVLTGLLSVSASVVCVKVFHLGLLAIAWANCLPMVLISGVILPIYFNAKMKISVRESAVRIWWPALLGCMPAMIVIGGWKYFHSPASWFSIAMVVAVSAGLTCISAWCFSLTPRERERLVKTLVLRRARDSSATPEKTAAATQQVREVCQHG
jgi:O-antigen/teichoic acid export membrane protein